MEFRPVSASRIDSLLMIMLDIARLNTGTLQTFTEICAGDSSVGKTCTNFNANISLNRCLQSVTSSFRFMDEGSSPVPVNGS